VLKIARRKQQGPNKSGRNLRGNSIEEGTSPEVVAHRLAVKTGVFQMNRTGRPKKNVLTETLREAMDRQIEINGEVSDLTVADALIEKIVNDALGEACAVTNDPTGRARELIFDRLEGRAVSKVEMSGPEGGPIETVETSIVLQKLFS
jgi:hypothetical protein